MKQRITAVAIAVMRKVRSMLSATDILKRICDNEECNEYILLCDRLKQQLKEKTENYVAHVKSLIEDPGNS